MVIEEKLKQGLMKWNEDVREKPIEPERKDSEKIESKVIRVKLIKCCVCLKKIGDENYFECKKSSCKKKYHFSCMEIPNVCTKCRLQRKMLPNNYHMTVCGSDFMFVCSLCPLFFRSQ